MLNYYAFVLILNSLLNCNVCFETGNISSCWAKIIINPLPKSAVKVNLIMSYRGITLAPTMYKIYSSILNERIVKWTDENATIADEQDGFCKKKTTKKRNANDHITSLTNIIGM